jgi:hypothetical protein
MMKPVKPLVFFLTLWIAWFVLKLIESAIEKKEKERSKKNLERLATWKKEEEKPSPLSKIRRDVVGKIILLVWIALIASIL